MSFLTRAALIQDLAKALEAGQYNGAPGTLTQGSALQLENISPVLHNVGFMDEHLVLQKMLKEKPCKATLAQFDRQLSYGNFGGSAQLEGAVGQEDTLDIVRVTVPMAYYSQVRKTTFVADMVDTVDGISGSDRQAESAAKVIAGDLEFDCLRGMDDFSNGGVFDGNPYAMSDMPNMRGLFLQVRQSDSLNTPGSHDLMFDEFGSDEAIDIPVNGFLNQPVIEDAVMRAQLNFSNAKVLLTDPRVLSQYNKNSLTISRIILGGSPQDATGADLKRQWTSGGPVEIKASRFLSGKTSPARARLGGPSAPSISGASVTAGSTPTAFQAGDVYNFFATSVNEIGESTKSNTVSVTVAANADTMQITITPPSGVVRHFNLYRSEAGGTKCRFIGRVKNSGSATTVFVDLGARSPGFVTSLLFDDESCDIAEMAPFSKVELGRHELAKPFAFFSFRCLRVQVPRKNVLLSNCSGTYFDR